VGENDYKAAIPVLVKYLDFRMPPPFTPYNPLTQQPTGGLYPAADVLARFGADAVPALKAALGDEQLHSEGRSNAAKALFVLTADKAQVIGLTMKTARLSGDPETADMLKKLATTMVAHCKPDEVQLCRQALNVE
jgi:hypothetical protein